MSRLRAASAARERWDSAERVAARRRTLLGTMGFALLLVIGRGAQLQGLEGEAWKQVAAQQQQARQPLPAARGTIYDRNGVPLARTRESFALATAPREIRDRRSVAAQLRTTLALAPATAARATDLRRAWVVVPGSFTVAQRRKLAGVRGLYFSRRTERVYPYAALARELLGSVAADGRALGGIEREMDHFLRGRDGYSVLRRDARGATSAAADLPVVEPTAGADVYLTIDAGLQQIADQALSEAIGTTRASGGDLLLLSPRTGEVLAGVSRRAGVSGSMAAFSEPYEPGSTLKPLFVAGLLATRRATLADRVYAEGGRWTMPNGRTVTDVEPNMWLTLGDAVRVSSNIAMAKMTARIVPAEQYRTLRAFGLGSASGVDFPAEAGGRLPRLAQWSTFTPASVAMGYEVSVTPLQLALAYGALANGGLLMEPRLLRSVRSAAGGLLREDTVRAVRRVIPAAVADSLRRVLVSVVAEGTGAQAGLSTFEVAGKTGTSRRTGAGGRYEAGSYNASFVGFFPASRPQFVIYVKLDRPQGGYYGGATAAPVSRATFEAILAAGAGAVDDRGLLAARLPSRSPLPQSSTPAEPLRAAPERASAVPAREAPATSGSDAPARASSSALPELRGLPMREAAQRLHALGYRVRLQGSGPISGTRPAAGTAAPRGATVLIIGEAP